jgi:hypothetical protein
MRLFKQKRGVESIQDMLLLFFEIFLLLVVGISLMFYTVKIKDDTLFQRIHHAKDISFLIDAMQSVPGNVIYYYPEGYGFDYNFEGNKAMIIEPNLKMTSLTSVYYVFAKDSGVNFKYPQRPLTKGMDVETKLIFKKTDEFEINPASEEIDLRICPIVNTKDSKITIKAPTDVLKGHLMSSGRVVESDAPLLVLEYGSVSDVNVEIYSKTSPEAMKLACLIYNELKKKGISSVILPSDEESLVRVFAGIGINVEEQIEGAFMRYIK